MKLRLPTLLLGVIITLMGCAGSQPSASSQNPRTITDTNTLLAYQDEISVEFLKKHLSAFAADSMEGRETGTDGLKKAADYLAKEYHELGLKPVGDGGTYFQHFELNVNRLDSVIFETYVHQDGSKILSDRSMASANSTANYIRAFGGTDTLAADVVFAGFGVNDPDRNVTHLQGADLKGKWVMVFAEIPHVVGEDTLIDPSINVRTRFRAIFSRGAEGVLLIPDMNAKEFKASAQQTQSSFGESEQMSLAYLDDGSGSSGGFSKGFNLINPALAAKILGVESIASYREKLVGNITDFKAEALSYSLTQIPYSSESTIETKNVLAYYEGADPKLKDEVVVMTSHYDHVGIGQPDSTGDRIYNGADDDGSGTIGLLNVAKAFVAAGENGVKPKRSILFLNVSAEEKGLFGSRYYSDHPVYPMEKTVANINTDMIGRIDSLHESKGIEEYTYIIGAEIISSQLDSLIKVANSNSGQLQLNKRYNDLNDPNQFYRRSDHWNFGRKGVPFVFFFTGVHEDYHRPSDEVHKIRFDKMAEVIRTIYASAVMVANADNPPEVDNQEFIEITKSDN